MPECASELVTATVSRPMRGTHPSRVLPSKFEWMPEVSGGSLHPAAGTTLTLTKDFATATSYDENGDYQLIPEHLETTLTVPPSGHYVWHVNPSTRPVPLLAGKTEAYTLSCPGESRKVVVAIGARSTQNLTCGAD